MAREPLYRKVETEMIRRIGSGEWETGRRLPNEFGLAREFGVSQGTMRRALITLEGMGLLDRKPGRGTLVAKPKPSSQTVSGLQLTDLSGAPLTLTVLRATASTARMEDPDFADMRVAKLDRILKRGSLRFALEEVLVSQHLCARLSEGAALDFKTLLNDHSIDFGHITETATASLTTMAQSVALSCDRHTALIEFTRTAFDSSRQPIAKSRLSLISEELVLSAAPAQ